MTAASDLGGAPGAGPVVPEQDEPVFHAPWERRVLALTVAMGATGSWTLDASRFAREDRPRDEYLAMSYYELWLAGLERLVILHDLAAPEELASGQPDRAPSPVPVRLDAEQVAPVLRRGAPTTRARQDAPAFAVGDRVRAAGTGRPGHTRLPSYVRGRTGTVTAVHGCHVFPDTHAHGLGEQPQWLYNVAFSGRALFGAAADELLTVSVDAFEPYLQAP